MFTYIPEFNGLTNVVYDDFRNDEEREFLTSLYNYASTCEKYGFEDHNFTMFYDDDTLTVAFDVIDESENHVLRSLRIDFTEASLLLGKDETHQYVSRLNVDSPEAKEYRKAEYTTAQLAEIAAQWIAQELSRKIERIEWDNELFRHRRYVLVDTNQEIGVSDSKNIFRRNDLGSPDKATIVYPSKKSIG